MEIINAGKKEVESCDPVARTAHQSLIADPANNGGQNFSSTVNVAAGTDRILFLHVVVGQNVVDPTIAVSNVTIGGVTPTLLNSKNLVTTGIGINLDYTNYTYYILESDIASLGASASVLIDTDIPFSGGGAGGINVRATQYENVNQSAPFFATNQNCIAGTVPNPHQITVASSENGLTHWQYTKASPINDSYNTPNLMDVLIQASGLVQNTGYQEGDLTDPHVLEINQLAGTFKGVIAQGINLFSNCVELPEPQCNCEINIETEPLYEYRDIWAEENGAIAVDQAEYSFGNGAAGFIGLPIDAGWEVIEMYAQADTNAAGSAVDIHLADFTTPSAAAPIIATTSIVGAVLNNASSFDDFSASPLPVPAGAILGFITGATITGNFTDVRVGARLRRQIGNYVSNVTLN